MKQILTFLWKNTRLKSFFNTYFLKRK